MKAMLILGIALSFLLTAVACGPKAFVRGEYDDAQRVNLLTDQWSESDMQKVARSLVASMVDHPSIQRASRPPLIVVTRLENRTNEHIDTQSLMDRIRVELSRSGKVAFVDREARDDIAEEYEYHASGMVAEDSRTGPGGQTGAEYIVNGRIDSIVQEVGRDKTIYYKVTLNLTNLRTGVITWTDDKEIRKAYRKRSVGL